MLMGSLLIFFFFQAEDGIRDIGVTGVQTCALPICKLLTEESPQIQGYDQEGYAARLRYNERDIAPALDALRGARATTGQLLDSMTDDDWAREGTHSESGRYTAEDWLRIYAGHAHNHAAQIRRLKETLQGS